MARCELEWHEGPSEVYKIRIFFRDGKKIEGCQSCTSGLLTNLYSTVQNWRELPNGKQFKISAAHAHDIRTRRVAPDLSSTWRDTKGRGSDMRY